jgi:hypothetical protein
MKIKWSVLGIALVIVSISCGSIRAGSPDQVRVEVSARERSGEGYVLQVTVTNISSAPISIFPSQLPWGNRWSLFVTAVAWREAAHHLKESGGIDDPPPQQRFEIKPGEALQGEVTLRDRFRDLEPYLDFAKEDVLIGWVYPFRSGDSTRKEWHSGWLTIPAKRK